MHRLVGAPEAPEFVRRLVFDPPDAAFDSAFASGDRALASGDPALASGS